VSCLKNISVFVFVLISVVLTISCNKNNTNENAIRSEHPKVLSRIVSNNNGNRESLQPNPRNQVPAIRPKINIGNNYQIIYIRNINLSLGIEEEQVIVAVDRENRHNLKIMVIEFDSVRNRYISAWETEIRNINYRSVSISYMDVVGDHGFEIIFHALSLDNKQVLNIFRRTHSPFGGINLFYESILNLEVNGEIEIQEVARSQAYHLGQRSGASFPVITFENINTDGDPQPSVLRTTYMWNYQANRYLNVFQEVIPARIIEEQKISQMLFNNTESFQAFLEGKWQNVNSSNLIISFAGGNNIRNEIIFYTSDTMEVLMWQNAAYSQLHRTINIHARNDQIHFITKRVTIRIENMNRIRVDVRKNDPRSRSTVSHTMDGFYTRIPNNMLPLHSARHSTPVNIVLNGEFLGANSSIIFEDHNFTFRSGNTTRRGIFSIYNFNNDEILELRFIDENFQIRERRIYRIDMNQQILENSIINNITLTRGAITINSFSPSGDDPIRYVQTILNKDNT